MSRIPDCNNCKYMKMYDYGSKIYYCDNEDRTDDMGKVGIEQSPEISPEWCPLREKE